MNRTLLDAATNAAAMLKAVYDWVDRVEANGGATSTSGIASCNAMLNSLKKNRKRCEELVMVPLRNAIEQASS